jgi:hypothetical protein
MISAADGAQSSLFSNEDQQDKIIHIFLYLLSAA